MIGLDPKGFCKLDGSTAGVGWWWGEVGGVVAGSDGAVANDGRFSASNIHADIMPLRFGYDRISEAILTARYVAIQGYLAHPCVRSSEQYVARHGSQVYYS